MDPQLLRALDDLATRRHGVATFDELLRIGFSAASVRRACRAGLILRLHQGVYRIVGSPRTWRQAVMGWVAAAGPQGFASHRTALALAGLTRGRSIEVISERNQPLRSSAVVSHRTLDLPAADHWRVDGIPTVAVARSLIDVGRYWGSERVGSLLDNAVRAKLTTYAAFETRVHALARSGRNGIGVARRVLAARGFDDGWGFEAAMSRAMRSANVPPAAREWPVHTAHRTYYVDFGFPDAMLGVECDSTLAHTEPYQFEADLVRQNAILRVGVLLLRYTPTRLREDPDGVVAEIEEERVRRTAWFSSQ